MRMSTVGLSLDVFCRGLLRELETDGYEMVAVASPDAGLAAVERREGVRCVGVPMQRRMAPLADVVSLWRLVGVMRRERPDMVHTITPKAGLLGMMAARVAGVPVRVHTFTGLLFPTARGWRRALLKLTDRLTCLCATHVVAEGEGVRSDLTGGGITRKGVRVLGHGNLRGVDLEHYSLSPAIEAEASALRERLGIAPGERVFVFVGRLVADKGLRELALAVKGLDCHTVIVGASEGGDGDVGPELFAGNPRVSFSGGWADDVRPWLAMADALVFPSYREGFPNVVLEAGAMERPSVVTDINGSREIITDGVNGLVVPARNAAALRGAMERFLDLSPAERCEMGRRARADVERRFDQRYVRQCLKDFYNEIAPTR